MVAGRDEDCVCLGLDFGDNGETFGFGAAAEVDGCAVAFCCGDFRWGGDGGHDDVGGCVEAFGGEGERLGMISFVQGMLVDIGYLLCKGKSV